MALDPMIPDKPKSAKPAAPTPTKSVNTSTLAGILAASGRGTPDPVPRYIPSYASPTGKPFQQASAANSAAIAGGKVPKPTNVANATKPGKPGKADVGGSSRTGSIEKGTAPAAAGRTGKPFEIVIPQEEMDAVQAASDALRLFQENQARQQLQTALGKIDRAAIDQYKGIANDYAARGMARSGGKLVEEQRAVSERDRSVNEATQAVTDFINELKLTGNLEQARTNLSKSQAFQDYISGRLDPAMGG